jgi:hypothetical protein
MTVPLRAWAAFVAFVVAMLALDLFVLHRRAHQERDEAADDVNTVYSRQ